MKIKVGRDLQDDIRRCTIIIREEIGYDRKLMMDANQVWEVEQAIEWMKELGSFPSPGGSKSRPAPMMCSATCLHRPRLEPLGIGVATGEHCQNRIIFKQLMTANAIRFCQIDACRLGGVNECLAVYLLAKKFNIPVCPHAGGVGLCEYVQHLAIWD